MKSSTRGKTLYLAQMAMLCAILLIMSFTPLGYLRIGAGLEISFMTVPVVLGAMLLGPMAGATMGLFFGLSSLSQCFGLSLFGTTLFGIQPVYMVITCIVPRILFGLISGLVFRSMKGKKLAYPVAALCGVAGNTVLFLGAVLLLFGQTDYIRSFGSGVWQILYAMGLLNALVEIPVCTALSAVLTRACEKILRK